MSPTEEILSYLLTGEEAQDGRIREAFEQGVNYGRSSERRSLSNSVEIVTTQKIIATLMRTRHWSLDETLASMELSKKDRQMYQKIFAARQPKKRKQKLEVDI